jgi:hypothetical protein
MATKKQTRGPQYWWGAKAEKVHELVFGVVKAMENQQFYREVDDVRMYRLYANKDVEGIGLRAATRTRNPLEPQRLQFNVVETVIDTFANKMGKNRPRPFHITDGATWEQMRRAKKLNAFTLGLFQETRFYETLVDMVWDSAVWGTGLIHIFNDGKRAQAERVLKTELLVDEAEGWYRNPRQMHRRKFASRSVLLEQFADDAEAEDAIYEASKAETSLSFRQTHADMVKVVESWHLPSGPDADDGRHVICVDKGVLLDEEWKRKRFPFAKLDYKPARIGFWGSGIAEELSGIQGALNRLARKIERIMNLHVSRTYLRRQAKIPKAHIDNDAGALIEVDDPSDIHIDNSNSVPPEFWQEREALWARAHEKVGVTQLSAAGKKPAGVDAAVALRELNDIESDRFYTFGQRVEQACVDAGELMLEEVEALSEDGAQPYEVRTQDKRRSQTVSWADVRKDRDSFVLKVFPVSSLPTTPAFRQQTVAEWVQNNWIDPAEAKRLLDFPDLEASNSLSSAALDSIDALIEDILEKGEKGYRAPEPYEDIKLGLKRVTLAYLQARTQGCPEDTLDVLREWIDAAKELIKQQEPPPPPPINATMPALPPGPAGAAMPMGPPPVPPIQ